MVKDMAIIGAVGMKIQRFEDIKAWQEARDLNNLVYGFLRRSCKSEFCLRDQIKRASISVMANIAEGFERRSEKAFVQFLNYSLSSASELQSHLYIALDQGLISNDEFDQIYNKATQVKGLTGAFIKYLLARGKQNQL